MRLNRRKIIKADEREVVLHLCLSPERGDRGCSSTELNPETARNKRKN